MINLIKNIILGSKDLPGYGPHPGTGILVILLPAFMLAGLSNPNIDWITACIIGFSAWMITIFPLWCVGCINRAKSYHAAIEHENSNCI